MRLERLTTDRLAAGGSTSGEDVPADLLGSVLARDLFVGGARWSKGRRLSAADLALFAASPPAGLDGVTVIVLEEGDLHEDEQVLVFSESLLPGLKIA